MPPDLRSFLERLDENGLLLELGRPVDPATEVARLMRELERRGVAGLFTDVRGSLFRLAYNLIGTREALALALGCAPAETARAFQRALKHRLDPVLCSEAPAQEIVHLDDADLRALPLVTHSAKDAGPYITAGTVIARDPGSGLRNVSVNRMMLVGKQETGIRMMPPQQLGLIQAKAEAAGHDLPMAVAVGLHPLDTIAAGTTLPQGDDELAFAGSLHGEPRRMCPAVTVDLEVPADAEVILEGYVPARVREPEGPFGDFLEYYVPEMPNHRFRLTAITHRRDAIFQTMQAGSPEDVNLLGISREAQLLEAAEAMGTEVAALRLRPTILGCAVAIRKRHDGEPAALGRSLLAVYPWLKYCIVVDPDVDVEVMDDVWWAVTTRSSPARSITVAKDQGFPRDPYGVHDSKAVIDATVPLGAWDEFERKRPPGGDPLALDDFVS